MDDGVWYLAHLQSEYGSHHASSTEDRRLFATSAYKIETIISRNDHLFSTATISFQPLLAGERVLKFGLLPNLRVSRVVDDHAQDIYYTSRTMAPKSMTKYALEQTRAQLQLCNFFFGKIPYDEISVTEQPDFNLANPGPTWSTYRSQPIRTQRNGGCSLATSTANLLDLCRR